MDNNENQINNENNCTWECKKLFLIAFMTFLGSFLAFYVLMHQTMVHIFIPQHKNKILVERQFMKNIERDFEIFKYNPTKNLKDFDNKISAIQTVKNDNEYVIFIDLKKFNNNEKNISFGINGNIVNISGRLIKNKRNKEISYYFAESFEVPEKIDTNKIKKEKINNNYIITIPIEN